MNYTNKYNKNRGYLRLDVWQKSINLYKIIFELLKNISGLDIKTKSQILNSVQSISANIAEGYGRRSIKEYLYFLYVSLGSSAESLSRLVALNQTKIICDKNFEKLDTLHFEIENKLLKLIKSLEEKKKNNDWLDHL